MVQHDRFLLAGDVAGDDGQRRFGVAQVDGLMRHTGRDEQEIAFLRDHRFLKTLAEKIIHLALQDIDTRFESVMIMRFRLAAGRDAHQHHRQILRSRRALRESRKIVEIAFGGELFVGPHPHEFGLFYIGQAGVVGAYIGMTAYMSNKK